MPKPRFYHAGDLSSGQAIFLTLPAAHHAVRVLRLRSGDGVTLFNGRGGEFSAEIVGITKREVAIQLSQWREIERESSLIVTLAQAVSSNEKMDFILQKAVELGVTRIQPLVSARSVVRLTGDRAEKRQRHWQQVVIAACEQCGRNQVPDIAPLLPLTDWLAQAPQTGQRFVLLPNADGGLRDFLPGKKNIILLVGPEGGFTPTECAAAQHHDFVPLRLGCRVLRTETAALAALAALQALWGDF